MARRATIFRVLSRDPWTNFAFETRLFDRLAPDQACCIVWKNRNAVVIGRGQNPWLEANLPYLHDQRIALLRRTSGGGAVYNDAGNVNFTFMAHRPFYRQTAAIERVHRMLGRMGLAASLGKRHDILVQRAGTDFKVSGSAWRESGARGLQHGTLLVDTDLDRLRRALTPAARAIETRCIRSLRSPVANLADVAPGIDVAAVEAALVAEFRDFLSDWGEVTVRTVASPTDPTPDDLPRRLASWDWVFGKTPRFEQRWDGVFRGMPITGVVAVNQGRICGFSLHAAGLERQGGLADWLLGCPFRAQALRARLAGWHRPVFAADDAHALGDWLFACLAP